VPRCDNGTRAVSKELSLEKRPRREINSQQDNRFPYGYPGSTPGLGVFLLFSSCKKEKIYKGGACSFFMISGKWERNLKLYKVLQRYQRMKAARLKRSLFGRLFGDPTLIDSRMLRKRLGKTSLYSEFAIEGPEICAQFPWRDSKTREGYDGEQKIMYRAGVLCFGFEQASHFSDKFWRLVKPTREFFYRKERETSQPFVETIDRREAETLVGKGYVPLGSRPVMIGKQNCPSLLGPSDWNYTRQEETVYLLAHPKTGEKDRLAFVAFWKPRDYTLVTG